MSTAVPPPAIAVPGGNADTSGVGILDTSGSTDTVGTTKPAKKAGGPPKASVAAASFNLSNTVRGDG